MKISKNTPSLLNQERLNAITPNHQDFNFEIWAMAVRQQMISALNHKESPLEGASETTISEVKMNP